MARTKGGIQVLRVETRSSVVGAIASHILGHHVHVVHEVPEGEELDIKVLVDERDRASEYLSKLRVHGNALPGVEAVVAGCRPEWTREEQESYFETAFEWFVGRAGPHSMVSCAAIHWHETSPHMQILIAAVGMTDERVQAGKTKGKDGKVRYRYKRTGRKVRRVGWTAIRDGFSPGKGRDSDRMSRMQDCFHAEVASRFGLERGEVGSQAVHAEIDRAKAARDRAEEAELEEAAVLERVALGRSQAALAEATADQLDARVATVRDGWGEAERESKRLKRENEDLAEKNKAAAATYAQVVEDIEAGREGSALGRELRETAEEAKRYLAGSGPEVDRERRALKAALAVSRHELGRSLSDEAAGELVQGRLELARRDGVRTLWAKLRVAAGEKGAAYLASLARVVGSVFGVRGPDESREGGHGGDRGSGIG